MFNKHKEMQQLSWYVHIRSMNRERLQVRYPERRENGKSNWKDTNDALVNSRNL